MRRKGSHMYAYERPAERCGRLGWAVGGCSSAFPPTGLLFSYSTGRKAGWPRAREKKTPLSSFYVHATADVARKHRPRRRLRYGKEGDLSQGGLGTAPLDPVPRTREKQNSLEQVCRKEQGQNRVRRILRRPFGRVRDAGGDGGCVHDVGAMMMLGGEICERG